MVFRPSSGICCFGTYGVMHTAVEFAAGRKHLSACVYFCCNFRPEVGSPAPYQKTLYFHLRKLQNTTPPRPNWTSDLCSSSGWIPQQKTTKALATRDVAAPHGQQGLQGISKNPWSALLLAQSKADLGLYAIPRTNAANKSSLQTWSQTHGSDCSSEYCRFSAKVRITGPVSRHIVYIPAKSSTTRPVGPAGHQLKSMVSTFASLSPDLHQSLEKTPQHQSTAASQKENSRISADEAFVLHCSA
ncbi:hypothetical protein Nepgr_029687 [Nepenthes gracilis]|uniref:Uncharacterized protein n=1 Tax=Nepenthes gracilis TaxID=150966 RepID=A0AAD3TEU3_NEPGR|nr:hypothetical protein Nepgr_029687 [Nepenthes gracilis]